MKWLDRALSAHRKENVKNTLFARETDKTDKSLPPPPSVGFVGSTPEVEEPKTDSPQQLDGQADLSHEALLVYAESALPTYAEIKAARAAEPPIVSQSRMAVDRTDPRCCINGGHLAPEDPDEPCPTCAAVQAAFDRLKPLPATPVKSATPQNRGVLCIRGHVDVCQTIASVSLCDRCLADGWTPQSALAEQNARITPDAPIKLPPEPVRKRAIDRQVYPPIFLTAEDKAAYTRWQARRQCPTCSREDELDSYGVCGVCAAVAPPSYEGQE